MKARYYLLGCLALAACDAQMETEYPVAVNFTQPFPATAPDLSGFLPRDRKRYVGQPHNSNIDMIISEKVLVVSRPESVDLAGAWLDSMGVPRRLGSYRGRDGMHYQVQVLAADSFRVRGEVYDTLLNLNSQPTTKLRHHRGWYYVSRPATEDSTKWEVERLGINNGQVIRQLFNPDSLRIRALDPALVQQKRENGQLIFTLAPQSRRAIWQVSSYDGLWIEVGEYLISRLGDKSQR